MCYLCYLCLLVDSDVQHILYFVVCFVCLRLVCAVLPVSLVCPFGFSSVYLDGCEPHPKCDADSSKCSIETFEKNFCFINRELI